MHVTAPELAAPAGTKGWATPDQWAAHRATIIRMYIDENNTLGQVKSKMERDFRFHATPRMYKARLKKWGIVKNLKRLMMEQEAGASAAAAGDDGDDDDVMIKTEPGLSPPSKEVASRKLNSRTHLAPVGPGQTLANAWEILVPAIARGLGAPHDQQRILHAFQALNRLVDLNCATGQWTFSPGLMASVDDVEWIGEASTSSILIKNGRVQEGFALLGDAMEQYKKEVKKGGPLLEPVTYMAAFNFLAISPQLWQIFLKYAINMVAIVHSKSHPLYRALLSLLLMGPDNFPMVSDILLSSYLEALEQYCKGWSSPQRTTFMITVRRFFLLGCVSVTELDRLDKKATDEGVDCANNTVPLAGDLAFLGQSETFVNEKEHVWPRRPDLAEVEKPKSLLNEMDQLLALRPARLQIRRRGELSFLSFEQMGSTHTFPEVKLEHRPYPTPSPETAPSTSRHTP